LKTQFVVHSTLIISSYVLDDAPKFSPRIQISLLKVHFSATC
jgi:hypothetical protein